MLFKFGAPCRSRAEWVGNLHALIVEPTEKLLLGLLVEEPRATPLIRVRVPFGKVDHADSEQVSLTISPADFKLLPAERAGGMEARPARGGASATRKRRGDEPSEKLLTARTRIECRDGEVGSLSAIQVDPRTGDLQAVTLPFGMPVTREVLIPFDHVATTLDDRVELHLDMDSLADFPTLRW